MVIFGCLLVDKALMRALFLCLSWVASSGRVTQREPGDAVSESRARFPQLASRRVLSCTPPSAGVRVSYKALKKLWPPP